MRRALKSLGEVGRNPQKFGRGREGSGGPPGGPGRVGMTLRISGRGQEDPPEVREGHPEVWVGSGGPPGATGEVRRTP